MGRSLGRALAAAALIVLAVAWLHLYEPASDTRLAGELQNAGHALLFGAVALLSLAALRALGREGAGAYVGALAVTLALGGLSELLQVASPVRDASLGDWLRDAAGALAALGLAAGWRREAGPRVAPLLVLTAALLLAAVAAPLLATIRDYRARDAAFPVLCCFTGDWERRFVRNNHIELLPAAPDAPVPGPGFFRMTFFPARWPGISVHEVRPDWSGYETLALDLYAEDPAPTAIVLRIDDLDHDGVTYQDRFNRDLTIEAGLNRIRVPIAEILDAPAGRRMDPRRIKRVFLFADGPEAPFTVYWDGLRLLPPAGAAAN